LLFPESPANKSADSRNLSLPQAGKRPFLR